MKQNKANWKESRANWKENIANWKQNCIKWKLQKSIWPNLWSDTSETIHSLIFILGTCESPNIGRLLQYLQLALQGERIERANSTPTLGYSNSSPWRTNCKRLSPKSLARSSSSNIWLPPSIVSFFSLFCF